MSKKINTQAMFFPGFIESDLENSDMIDKEVDRIVKDIHAEHPKLVIGLNNGLRLDYKAYEREVGKAWAKAYASYVPEFVKSCEFDVIYVFYRMYDGIPDSDYRDSPRRLYVNIEMEEDWLDRIKAFISSNQEWFKKRIAEDWTSRDGFHSYMENNLEGWLKGLEDEDERYVGTTLGYMIYKEHGEFWKDINEKVCAAVPISRYISMTSAKKQELRELIKEEEEERRIKEYDEKHQLTIDFSEIS